VEVSSGEMIINDWGLVTFFSVDDANLLYL